MGDANAAKVIAADGWVASSPVSYGAAVNASSMPTSFSARGSCPMKLVDERSCWTSSDATFVERAQRRRRLDL